jgi:hypothetical protein
MSHFDSLGAESRDSHMAKTAESLGIRAIDNRFELEEFCPYLIR